jgi:protein-tyrosine kinase
MGRMLEALKRSETPRLAPVPANGARNEAPPAATAVELEIPFIEWGPLKSMEASPSVLAAPGPPARIVRPTRLEDETAVALVAPPTPVMFRALPAARPAATFAPELVAFHDPQSVISGQYRELLRALLAASPLEKSQALLFTAASAGRDTTTVLLNVAISAARLGWRCIAAVDANLAKPGLAAALGVAEKPGLREVLAGVTPLDEAVQETAQPNLAALTSGITPTTGGVRFRAETMRSVLRHLRERYDLIFVEAGTWDGSAEMMNLATACDNVYLLLSANESDTPQVDDLLRRLPEQGAKLAGCIIAGQ